MSAPICLGDATSSGGKVTDCQLAGSHSVHAKPIAVLGDTASCPRHGGSFRFVEGHSTRRMQGKPIVLEGHKLACGCHAIATAAQSINVG